MFGGKKHATKVWWEKSEPRRRKSPTAPGEAEDHPTLVGVTR